MKTEVMKYYVYFLKTLWECLRPLITTVSKRDHNQLKLVSYMFVFQRLTNWKHFCMTCFHVAF